MKACCFIGHRNAPKTQELSELIKRVVRCLIKDNGVELFCFGSKSDFDELCHSAVSAIQQGEYPNIELAYIRSRKQSLSRAEKNYLYVFYDETILSSGVEKAGKASYLERNQAMINACEFCVFYYDENYQPPIQNTVQSKSGTRLAYEYAKKKQKTIINLYE